MKGFFISVEGGDGSGKSTQLNNICGYLESKGLEYVLTREPGGTPIGEKIREVILDPTTPEMSDIAEALLYAASRAQHVSEVIGPAIDSGKIVVCDRFVDSSIAYQGYGRELGEVVAMINEPAVGGYMPDITIFLDVSARDAMDRISRRGLDRLEKEELDFHQRVYLGYKKMIEEDGRRGEPRIHAVEASRSPEEVWEDIKDILDRKLTWD